MIQKVLKVGTSAGVTIPKGALTDIGLKIGDPVRVDVDRKSRSVIIRVPDQLSKEDAKIAQLTMDFIHRYRKDLEALSRL